MSKQDEQELLMRKLGAFQRLELAVSDYACSKPVRLQYDADLLFLAEALGLRAPTQEVQAPTKAQGESKFIPRKNGAAQSPKTN